MPIVNGLTAYQRALRAAPNLNISENDFYQSVAVVASAVETNGLTQEQLSQTLSSRDISNLPPLP